MFRRMYPQGESRSIERAPEGYSVTRDKTMQLASVFSRLCVKRQQITLPWGGKTCPVA